MPKIRIGGHVINTDVIAHVDDPYRAMQPDRTKWKPGTQGYEDDALRIQFGNNIEDVILFGDEAKAFRENDKDVTDLTPRPPKAPEVAPAADRPHDDEDEPAAPKAALHVATKDEAAKVAESVKPVGRR